MRPQMSYKNAAGGVPTRLFQPLDGQREMLAPAMANLGKSANILTPGRD